MAYTGNSARRITINNVDVTEWCIELPSNPLLKTEWGQIPSLAQANLIFRSDDKFFHPAHPASLFFSKPIDQLPVQIFELGRLTWEGKIINYSSDYQTKRTTVVVESTLQRLINQQARIDTAAITPAEAIKRFLTLYNVNIDSASFGRAESLLNDIPVSVRVTPSTLTWQGTMGDILNLLTSAGIGRLYLTDAGSVAFDTYELISNPIISITIQDDDILSYPTITDDFSEEVKGYSIQWLYGTETSGSTDKLQTLDFGANSAVHVLTQASAIYIGETWMAQSQRKYNRIILGIDKAYAPVLTLRSYILLESFLLGISAPAEVIGIDNSDARWLSLTCRVDKAML